MKPDRRRHPQSDPPTTGSSGGPMATDPKIGSHRASRELAILIGGRAITAHSLRPLPLCTSARVPAVNHRRGRSFPGPPPAPRRAAGLTHEESTNPGNTAGPVLPHRPSEAPPVRTNHREGLVTCSTVATCTEKTTPVGQSVT